MKKYSGQDKRFLAIWAGDCAEHVLPFFERAFPNDDRPRKAIEICRTWIRTGVFKMSEIRGASLAAHASARKAKGKNDVACFSARAAGQAVATVHVPQHAFGAAYYALRAVAASEPAEPAVSIEEERNWMARHLRENLRQELRRITIQKRGAKFLIKIHKDKDF